MDSSDPSETTAIDPKRLDHLVDRFFELRKSDPNAEVASVLEELDPALRAMYRYPLLQRLEELSSSPQAPEADDAAALGATLEQPAGFRPSPVPSLAREGSRPSFATGSEQQPLPESIGKFRIKRELGRGAFGVVYLGYDEELQRNVAIKLSLVADEELQERLRVEASKVAQIESTGIVPVYHIGKTDEGAVFIVQKYIDGSSLRTVLEEKGTLSPIRAAQLLREIAVGLEPAHAAEILHRDLKPDNILVDKKGKAWIADFGLAISEEEQVEERRALAGTPPYMSPEQIQGRVDFLDPRTDLWALGVIFYELLSGKLPFKGKTRQSLSEQICELDPRPLQQRAPELLTAEMNDVFLRCCAKKPSDRFASARELIFALDELIESGLSEQNLAGEFITAARDPSTRDQRLSGSTLRSNNDANLNDTQRDSVAGTQRDSLVAVPSSEATTPSWVRLTLRRLAVFLGVLIVSILASYGVQRYVADSTDPAPASKADSSPQVFPDQGERRASKGSPNLDSSADLASTPGLGSSSDSAPSPELEAPEAGGELATRIQPTSKLSAEKLPESDNVTPASDDLSPPDGSGLASDAPMPERDAMSPTETIDQDTGRPAGDGSEENPWVVALDGTGTHRSIQDAIDVGLEGAHIHIKPGIYSESLQIDRVTYLTGLGEPGECEIEGVDNPPLTIRCDGGEVTVRNLRIDAKGHRTTKEFNAVDVKAGTLVLYSSQLETRSFNCIKAFKGTRVAAIDCRFVDSKDFAISTLNHDNLVLRDCDFLQSGVQLVGSSASIEGCDFFGHEGIYAERTGAAQVRVVGCLFEECSEYGILSTTASNVGVTSSTFRLCNYGAKAGLAIEDEEAEAAELKSGRIGLEQCRFEDCNYAVSTGDTSEIVIGGKCQISGGKWGVAIAGGIVRATDLQIRDTGDGGMLCVADGSILAGNVVMEQTGLYGVKMDGGQLQYKGGRIEGCSVMGVSFGEGSVGGRVEDVVLKDNSQAGIGISGGSVQLSNVNISGSDVGLFALSDAAEAISIQVGDSSFEEIAKYAVYASGSIDVAWSNCDFSAVPAERRTRSLGNGKIRENPDSR